MNYKSYVLVLSLLVSGLLASSSNASPNVTPFNAPYSSAAISRSDLRNAIVYVKTSSGRYAVMHVMGGDNLTIEMLRVYDANGKAQSVSHNVTVKSSFLYDIDSRKSQSSGADFQWEGIRPGVSKLVPRNNAKLYLAVDFDHIKANDIKAASLSNRGLQKTELDYAVVLVRTDQGHYAKMIVERAGVNLKIHFVTVYNPNGSEYRKGRNITIKNGYLFDLESFNQMRPSFKLFSPKQKPTPKVDLLWKSAAQASLQPQNSAKIGLYWHTSSFNATLRPVPTKGTVTPRPAPRPVPTKSTVTPRFNPSPSKPISVGERYKIKMWVTVLKSDDGFADNTLECYGILRVNDEVWWQIDRSAAGNNKRGKNQILEISENAVYRKRKDFSFDYFYDTKPKFDLNLTLTDHDSASADDTFGRFIKSLDLKSMVGKTRTWDWDSKHGEASRLHIRVERVDYLYAH